MSKFSELLEQAYLPLEGVFNEQEELTPEKEAPEIETPTEQASELPIVTNDDVRRLATALQVFYSKQNPEISEDVVNQIRSIGVVSDDAKAKAVVTTLADLLDPSKIDTNPATVKNSEFSN
jgi:hypothetical protein